MDPQNSQGLSSCRLAKELILDAQENLVHSSQRAEQALHGLELARNILAFSQTHIVWLRPAKCSRKMSQFDFEKRKEMLAELVCITSSTLYYLAHPLELPRHGIQRTSQQALLLQARRLAASDQANDRGAKIYHV